MPTSPYTESWLIGPGSTKFYTRTYLPPTPNPKPHAALVFVHGFAEHIGRYVTYHSHFSAQGIAVFAYDQRGFGLTALDTDGNKSAGSKYGKTSWIQQMEDVVWAVKHAKETFRDVPLFLMGHSMGGEEVLGLGCHDPTAAGALGSLSGIIASSPSIRPTHPVPKVTRFVFSILGTIVPTFVIPAPVNAEDLSRNSAVVETYKADPLVKVEGSLKAISDFLDKGEWLLNSGYTQWSKDIPILIAHGTADQVTDHEVSRLFYNRLPEGVVKKISFFEGSYHELHNEPDGVRQKLTETIIAFIQEHISDKKANQEVGASASELAETTVEAESRVAI